MITNFEELSEKLGFRDGEYVKEQKGSIPSNTETLRLCFLGQMKTIRLNHLTPNSTLKFKVNGWLHTEMFADKNGEARMEFETPVDLDKIHCPQICFQGSEKSVEYEIELNN
jgi:hypothetical protein